METKETSVRCCWGIGGKHKKVFVILSGFILLAIIMLSIAVAGWKIREARNGGNMMYGYNNGVQGFGGMMNRGKRIYPTPIPSNIDNQFMLPQDALKSGELAIVVNNLDAARKAVTDIAAKSEGNIYATFIAYASNNVKNGSIVVQVPADKFDATFGDLKKVGNQVVQEKTQQIAPNNYYPMPLVGATEKVTIDQAPVEKAAPATDIATVPDAKPEVAIYPSPIGSQLAQDKGYIRVVFVDYGSVANSGSMMQRQDIASNMFGIGNVSNQNIKNNLWVIVGIKLIFLIAILGLLIIIFKKIFHRIRGRKENVRRVHIVRQAPKSRQRIVRIQKKK